MDQSSFVTTVNNITERIANNGKKDRGDGVPLPKPSMSHNLPTWSSIDNDREIDRWKIAPNPSPPPFPKTFELEDLIEEGAVDFIISLLKIKL